MMLFPLKDTPLLPGTARQGRFAGGVLHCHAIPSIVVATLIGFAENTMRFSMSRLLVGQSTTVIVAMAVSQVLWISNLPGGLLTALEILMRFPGIIFLELKRCLLDRLLFVSIGD